MQQLNEHLLDNPAWHALLTRQSDMCQACGGAVRYAPDFAPFAAVGDLSSAALADLHDLILPEQNVLIQTLVEPPPHEHLKFELVGVICQMVAIASPITQPTADFVALSVSNKDSMQQLALRTKPGPFGSRTHEMGSYLGFFAQGSLVAMAGERMNLNGYVEISAVCVEEALRGKGMAAKLMSALHRQILDRGDTPFLHVLKSNFPAISLYERIGFQTRREFNLYRVSRGG